MTGYILIRADARTIPLADRSVDAIVTDPPYGLGFMGAQWDGVIPPASVWSAVLDALKPGRYMLAFGGTRTYHRLTCAIEDAGFEIRDCLMWLYGSGFPKGKACLKPGWEPIVLARRPGPSRALSIDECRIEAPAWNRKGPLHDIRGGAFGDHETRHHPDSSGEQNGSDAGRWPANVILDEAAGAMLDAQSGTSKSNKVKPYTRVSKDYYSGSWPDSNGGGHTDSGGASRFFYCPKASRSDRNGRNDHPSVKPTDLMRWLCRLITQPGDVILDPFMGSGSTGQAAVSIGRSFIGIDKERHYVDVSQWRIERPHAPTPRERPDESPGPLFGHLANTEPT